MTETHSTRPMGTGGLGRRAAVLGLAIMAALAASVGVASTGEASPVVAPPYMYFAAHSGKVLDLPGGDHSTGALIQWRAHGGDNQRFTPQPFATVGDIHLVILQSAETGHVLDAGDSSTAGTSVVTTTWAGSPSQVWWQAPFGNTGYMLFVNMSSGYVIDVAGGSTADGAGIIQWP